MKRALLAVAAIVVACSGSSRLGSRDTVANADNDAGAIDAEATDFRDVSLEARVASGEMAWLVAHLADNPERANLRDSDSVRRLAQMGPEGVLAIAEVFRVGDGRRVPFAHRVVERVALRRCLRDESRAAWVIAHIERGTDPGPIEPDAGILWQIREDRWSFDAVERLRAWARDGARCDTPGAVDAGSDASDGTG